MLDHRIAGHKKCRVCGREDGCRHYVKPPISITPKHIHDLERKRDIAMAILRYVQEGYPIPLDWVEEYNGIPAK